MFFLFVSFHGCEKDDVRSLEKIEMGDEECGTKLATGLRRNKKTEIYWGLDERVLVAETTVSKGEERFKLPVSAPASANQCQKTSVLS